MGHVYKRVNLLYYDICIYKKVLDRKWKIKEEDKLKSSTYFINKTKVICSWQVVYMKQIYTWKKGKMYMTAIYTWKKGKTYMTAQCCRSTYFFQDFECFDKGLQKFKIKCCYLLLLRPTGI